MADNLQVTFDGQRVPAEAGLSLFDLADRLDIHVPSSCRRAGRCRECMVEVETTAGTVTERATEEVALPEHVRLACRCRLAGPGAVRIRSWQRGTMHIEETAQQLPVLAGSTAEHDPAVYRRDGFIHLDELRFEDRGWPLLGVAVDVGTTTVVLRVLDLESGRLVAADSFENPQRVGGSEVMARIQYDAEHPGHLLQRILLRELAEVVQEMPIPVQSIYEYVIVGNSTMRDLAFGLPVTSIGQRPYHSITEQEWRAGVRTGTGLEARARDLRLPGHREARVRGLPLVSGHVGADAAACLLALEPHRQDELVAIMDFGTNTELFLGHRGRLVCASCPAGPAFEGRSISCGMPALDGAIARVQLREDGRPETSVLGGRKPRGICGSGLIDLLSELRRTGRLNAMGRFEDGATEYVVDRVRGIALRESDINELAQAKAANVAGLALVAKHYGCEWSEVKTLYLAGGFGRHIDVRAARRIGLIPDLPEERVVTVGNAALEGAVRALLSVRRRVELAELVRRIEHVELEQDPAFFDYFVSGCQFRPMGSGDEGGTA